MDSPVLVDRDLAAGQSVVDALDAANFPIVAAFWYYSSDSGDWRLWIGTPRVDEAEGGAALSEIYAVLRDSLPRFPVLRVTARSAFNPVVRQVRFFLPVHPFALLGDSPLTRASVGNVHVEGIYLYRAERILEITGTQHVTVVVRDKVNKVWTPYRCELTLKDNHFQAVTVDGYDWPQRLTKRGLRVKLNVLARQVKERGRLLGEIERWEIDRGRLESVETLTHPADVRASSVNVDKAG